MIEQQKDMSEADLMKVANETHVDGFEIPDALNWTERQLYIFLLKTANLLMKLDSTTHEGE